MDRVLLQGAEAARRAARDLVPGTYRVRVDEDLPSGFERLLGRDFRRFMLEHKFGVEEIVTKLSILRDEFAHLHEYNPIENVTSRLKSPESLVDKLSRKGIPLESEPTFDQIRASITDVGGVRVVCSFVSDVVRVFELLADQVDIDVVEVRDYISTPKPNGYRSLHALVEVPVFLSGGSVPVLTEVQFRTIAMDFWASLEHKIYYKYRRAVPPELLTGLREAAEVAASLDGTMERLHQEVQGLDDLPSTLLERLRTGDGAAPALLDTLRSLGG